MFAQNSTSVTDVAAQGLLWWLVACKTEQDASDDGGERTSLNDVELHTTLRKARSIYRQQGKKNRRGPKRTFWFEFVIAEPLTASKLVIKFCAKYTNFMYDFRKSYEGYIYATPQS